MSEGPKLQEALPGDPPGKIKELVLELSGGDTDMPEVAVWRQGEPEATLAGTWLEVGPALRLEAANTPDVSFVVRGSIEIDYPDGESNYDAAELLVTLEDWCLESEDEDDLIDGVTFWTEAPWLSNSAYEARLKRLTKRNDDEDDEALETWLALMMAEVLKRERKDERAELKRLQDENERLRAEIARLQEKTP